MRFLALGLAVLAMAASLPAQASSPAANSYASYSYRILDKPTSSDERAIRTLGLLPEGQRRSDALFAALQKVLGGSAPKLNFVPTGSELVSNHMSANIRDNVGGPLGTINIDPLAYDGLINDLSPQHNGVVNQVPHEMAHTRQTRDVLLSLMQREGGAQAFADYVTTEAAKQANIPYLDYNFDGAYAPFVKQAQARGLDWLLGGQFGHAPVSFP